MSGWLTIAIAVAVLAVSAALILPNLTRAGQLAGVANGLRRGVDVFVDRFRKNGGSQP